MSSPRIFWWADKAQSSSVISIHSDLGRHKPIANALQMSRLCGTGKQKHFQYYELPPHVLHSVFPVWEFSFTSCCLASRQSEDPGWLPSSLWMNTLCHWTLTDLTTINFLTFPKKKSHNRKSIACLLKPCVLFHSFLAQMGKVVGTVIYDWNIRPIVSLQHWLCIARLSEFGYCCNWEWLHLQCTWGHAWIT